MKRKAKYELVTEWIEERIASGELIGGEKIESENEISNFFNISRQTARHAIGNLVEKKILYRVQGSGTYVSDVSGCENKQQEISKSVTIISTYTSGYIFPRILQEMVNTLGSLGYSARIMFTNNSVETEKQLLLRILEENSRDALIVEPVKSGLPNPNLKYYRRLKARGIPIVFFNTFYPELDIPHISMNDVLAGKAATDYLIEKGHREIGGIFKSDDGQGRRRYQGYVKALEHAGIALDEEKICWVDTQELKDDFKYSLRIWQRLKKCTACVCYNDEVAHSISEKASEYMLRIPEQLSIVSIDNSERAESNHIPLTSVSHPMERLGEMVAKKIVWLIHSPGEDVTYEFPVDIRERNSVIEIDR